MRLLVGLGIWGCVMAAAVPAYAAEPDAAAAQFTCDLTGDCDTAVDPASSAPTSATPGKPAARGSATRGFSFQRGTQDGVGKPAATATASAVRPVARPAQVGSANLGLSFLPNSATLTDEAKARLAKYAAALSSAKLSTRRLRIEGHTDASGGAVKNQDLSRRRAQAAADFLIQAGVDRQRLDVVGYGASRPLAGTAPAAAANRRVMAVLL